MGNVCAVEETLQDKGHDQKIHRDWHREDDADCVGDAQAPLDVGPAPHPVTCGGNRPSLVPMSTMTNQRHCRSQDWLMLIRWHCPAMAPRAPSRGCFRVTRASG